MSLTHGKRPKRPKPQIIRDLEEIRRNMVVANAEPCSECETVPARIDCPVCEGTGVVSSDGMYHPSVMNACMGMVIGFALEMVPDYCTEVRAALRWANTYQAESFVSSLLETNGASRVELVERIRGRLEVMGERAHPLMLWLFHFLETIPEDADRETILKAVRDARMGIENGDEPT